MANSPQARKRARQNARQREHNVSQRSALRSSIKKLLKIMDSGDRGASEQAYRETVSKIDGSTSKGLHHRNRASRLKSRLNNRLRALSA